MNTDAILYDILCHLYPYVTYSLEHFLTTVGVGLLTFLIFVILAASLKLDDGDIFFRSLLVVFLLIFLGGFFASGFSMKEDKTDRLIQELIKDPAALKVVQETRYRLEWLEDPKKQRNKETTK